MTAQPAATTPARHPALTVALHWMSAFAVILAFALAWSREALDDPQPRAALMQVHQAAGLFVLGLLILRVGTRLTQWSSRPRHDLPRALALAALAGHLALYALLLAMPLLGWALANAQGHAVGLPGLPAFPTLVGTDPDLADTIESWHVGISWVLLGVVGMHVGAVLFHRFVRRDDVLASMLPAPAARRGRRASRAQESRSF